MRAERVGERGKREREREREDGGVCEREVPLKAPSSVHGLVQDVAQSVGN